MIVRKTQQQQWDTFSLDQIRDDIYEGRTRDIPDSSKDPLIILLAIEATTCKLRETEND